MTKIGLQRELEAARETVGRLVEQRHTLEQEGPKREAELAEISYSALVEGNPVAKKRLAELHRLAATEASEIAAVDAAIAEGRRRLAAVEQRVRQADERHRVKEVLRHADRLSDHGARMDALASELAEVCALFQAEQRAIVRLGVEQPSAETLNIFLRRALLTATRGTALQTEFLAGNQRITFAELGAAWSRNYADYGKRQLRFLGDDGAEAELEHDGEAAELEPAEAAE
jgi:hypothetical protein